MLVMPYFMPEKNHTVQGENRNVTAKAFWHQSCTVPVGL